MAKSASNPMMEMAFKAMGFDPATLLDQARGIGTAFASLQAGQAELHAKIDTAIDMLTTLQIAAGIAPAYSVTVEQMIAMESRKFLGEPIMNAEANDHANTAGPGTGPGPGQLGIAYVKLEELLKIREGVKLKVYRDSRGLLTVGIGHLVTAGDELQEDDVITTEQCDALFRTDARKAMDAAVAQMHAAGIVSPDFLPWLASVNYQLGTAWTAEFHHTWAMVCAGRYGAASDNLDESDWAYETPVRVRDFQRALRALPPKAGTAPAPGTQAGPVA